VTVGTSFFFAGGGTGGHIYPAIAVAEQIVRLAGEANVHFFCSSREIDLRVLSQAGFRYTALSAKGLSFRPGKLIAFCRTFVKSYRTAKGILAGAENAVVIGVGGFVAAPVCLAAHRLKVPVVLLNVDILPGRANRLIGRFAGEILVQYEETAEHFAKSKATVTVVGCPLRSSFADPQAERVIEQLGLESKKKILLITGASSGSQSINEAVCLLLARLEGFADDWQIVHLTGLGNLEAIKDSYAGAKIGHKVLGYYDGMADLLSAADLVVGRSGAVSAAEYAAAGVASICVPYPYHRDRHQYLHAGKLVEAGAAVVVDDLADAKERAEGLWRELEGLLKSDERRRKLSERARSAGNLRAASMIAEKVIDMR
jgi:UDP-N-acetylglucosamine--N-acetylmuramyl-(pentapeptide) pyrophosphoryl-undecaprenol N-acetylglucosamine transferase